MDGKRHWYVIHTYSGYENKVSANLERKVHSLGMDDKIFRIMIPLEKEIVVDDKGKKKVVPHKVFPGYVLVEMIVDERTWYVVRNTPGVTGFVGPDNKQPVPLSDDEVARILRTEELNDEVTEASEIRPQINFRLQQTVRLKSGSFADKEGTISAIDVEKGKLTVMVELFGRETPVEIDYTQVEEVE